MLAHRGASASETENTLPAFRRAMEEGADGVELDVQRCATGEVVVFHDDDLRRLAARPEVVGHLPLPALREVRLCDGARIPTLEEAIEACGPQALFNIEIKYAGIRVAGCRGLVESVAKIVRHAKAEARVLVSGFSPTVVWLWRRLCPDVPCGLLFERSRPFRRPWPLRTEWLSPLLRPAALHPAAALCSPNSVLRWQRQSYLVNAWTVDDPARIEALARMGVDGIITNQPGLARAALVSLSGPPSP